MPRNCLATLWCGGLILLLLPPSATGQGREPRLAALGPTLAPLSYEIDLAVDYRAARFSGHETVRLTNATRQELDGINFYLYPNVGLDETEEPWVTVQAVRVGSRQLRFTTRSRGAMIRVALPTKVLPGQSLALSLDFEARIPPVQREETSLLAHFLQEVGDATSSEQQGRDARDIFFAGDQAMLLGYFFPMVARQENFSAEQGLTVGAGGVVFSDIADYEVKVKIDDGLVVVASGSEVWQKAAAQSGPASRPQRDFLFRGERLRGFALVFGERLKAVEKQVGGARVASYFREGDERLGQRSLEMAARAIEVYNAAFGPYPYPALNVVELPLPAGYSGIEFPGLVALAQAYYIDFEAPQASRLPAVVRDHADLIKSALEFTLAHEIAHQWWGAVVGSDPQRTPYLDEALAHYSAAYYYEAAYGPAAGETAVELQLRAPYHAFRFLGGLDQEVDKPAREFRSNLQYAAIVQAKAAMLFVALRRELGDARFFEALRAYFAAYRFRVVSPDHLRQVFLDASDNSKVVRSLFQRWIKEKHGDEDIGTPDAAQLTPSSKIRSLGRVFAWLGRTAARPF